MRFSILGLVLALAYLPLPLYYMGRVVAKNSFGGLFSEEFTLFFVTMPFSPVGEILFKRYNYVRLVFYLVAALLNASILYALGWGLQWLVQR